MELVMMLVLVMAMVMMVMMMCVDWRGFGFDGWNRKPPSVECEVEDTGLLVE